MAGHHHPHHDALKNADGSWKFTNRLAAQTSPYLLQHAHNPVDWHAWGPDAFELSRRTNKPIFLSIGYSTCYWCHVMERQVFESPTLAQLANELFVCIKVDREERPDIDDIYMTAVQLMTGRGGWPMSVFLTPPGGDDERDPGLRPFYAGTYIPPSPSHGIPGFGQLAQALAQAWKDRRADVLRESHKIAHAVRAQVARGSGDPVPLGAFAVQDAANALLRTFDSEHGGFGGAPKFPQPANLLLLLRVYENQPTDELWQPIALTLDRMARGGMYDQIAGGFHRYSTDEKWLVPHFEKMLYDNGQLLEVYALAHRLHPDASTAMRWPDVMRQTCDYVLREMTDSSGAFWSAQDAEVDAHEGGNYVWTPAEVDDAIGDPALSALARTLYGLDLGTNFRDPHIDGAPDVNVLFMPVKLDELAAKRSVTIDALSRSKLEIDRMLLSARSHRKQPATDDKVLTSWNGMMIAGLADAGGTLGEPDYIQAAETAAEAVLRHLSTPDGGLLRTMRHGDARVPAFLEDYAFFSHGLIRLHRATSKSVWLDHAIRLTNHAIALFASPSGGYFDTLADQADLFVRTRSSYDGAVPSGNSRMIGNLVALHAYTGDATWLDRATTDLRSFSAALVRRGVGMVHTLTGLLAAIRADPARFASQRPDDVLLRNRPLSVTLHPEVVDLSSGVATLDVTLHIGDEYHLTAHEPGVDGLVPTTLSIQSGKGLSMSVAYPAGDVEAFAFADEPVRVYQGTVTLRATLSREQGVEDVVVPKLFLKAQVCTDVSCLEPRTHELPLQLVGV